MKLYIISFALIILSVSCKKSFLDIDDNSEIYRQDYVKDLRTLQHHLNGVYLEMASQFEYGVGGGYNEVIADNLKPTNLGNTMALIPHYLWAQKADPLDKQTTPGADERATAMNPWWKTGYLIVRDCNFILEKANEFRDEDASWADYMRGQALALRALIHFRLVNTFAQHYSYSLNGSHIGVPYVTTFDVNAVAGRLSVAEVYDRIISDFEQSLTLLPQGLKDTRVVNQPAVRALLSRVYLFKEDYAKAKQYGMEVASQYPLLKVTEGYPDDLFKFKYGAPSESLFQLSPQGGGFPGETYFLSVFFQSYVTWRPTKDIIDILNEYPDDVRKAWVGIVGINYRVTKFPADVAPEVSPAPEPRTGAYYQPMVRSSEVFLNIAEASAKSGDEATARTYLNSIRKRANPTAIDVNPTGAALIDSIYKERRKELCFEGFRMPDLQRWKLGVHRKDVLAGAPADLNYPSDKAIAPIPPFDVKLAGIPQNVGY